MKVLVIVKASSSSEAGEMPSQELLTEMGQFNEELSKAGIMLEGAGLHPTSRGSRVLFSGKQRSVIHGPFPEINEIMAGYWVWKVQSMEEAIDWVKRCPNPMKEDCYIEIRRFFEAEDFGQALTPDLREQEAAVLARTLGLDEVRFEAGSTKTIAGLNATYTHQTRGEIPSHWSRFVPLMKTIPHLVHIGTSYGVVWDASQKDSFNYLTGVEVSSTEGLPSDFTHLQLPAGRFAVFTHSVHITQLPATIDKIWTKWVPECGLKIASGICFEKYLPSFDPEAGIGGTEVWIPLA